jgi:hypothetical protein
MPLVGGWFGIRRLVFGEAMMVTEELAAKVPSNGRKCAGAM